MSRQTSKRPAFLWCYQHLQSKSLNFCYNGLSNMNKQISLSRYILVILCASIVFTALVLVILNSWMQNQRLASLGLGSTGVDQIFGSQSFENGYKSGYLAAREKYTMIAPLPAGAVVMALSGTISSVNDKQIVVTATNLDTDSYVDGVSNDRTVLITASTTIMQRIFLSPEEQAKQIDKWSKTADRSKTSPPAPYTENKLSLSDLKAGQTVAVIADEDIRLKESFNATQVILTQIPK